MTRNTSHTNYFYIEVYVLHVSPFTTLVKIDGNCAHNYFKICHY